jgi:hypothetical protein
MKPVLLTLALGLAAGMAAVSPVSAQAPAAAATPAAPVAPRYVPEDHRPPLFFREDFTDAPEETPVTQASITNRSLAFGLYGPGKDGVAKSKHASPKDDPSYVWLGACLQLCGVTLRHRDSYVDLTGLAKIRWRTKQTGFHQLRLIVKLADGTMLVSDYFEGGSTDWRETEVAVQDIRWRRLDTRVMNDGPWVEKPDLSKVDEIGWTDLAAGSGHGSGGLVGSSRTDWIEVYGLPVKRQP